MSTLTLELVSSSSDSVYAQVGELILELESHVHSRIERFVYQDDIKPDAVSLDYIEGEELDSHRDLQVVNRTYTVSTNAPANLAEKRSWERATGKSFTTRYRDVLITDQTFIDERGTTRPLFHRHVLPDDTIEVSMERVRRGNTSPLDSGWRVDLEAGCVYTNYQNTWDPVTGDYTFFYLVSSNSDGDVTRQMLSPRPAVPQADWSDIDLETGRIKEGVSVWYSERSSSGYSFQLSRSSTWYMLPVESSLLQPRLPIGRDPGDPWYLRFSRGDLSQEVNGQVHRYWVPEYDHQPFQPSKPYMYSTYERAEWVSERVLAATRQNLAIIPESRLHLTVFVRDYEGVLLRVLTTDASLHETRYSDTDVHYEADQILSWDNTGGFVTVGMKLQTDWQYAIRYHYEADDYEYTPKNLNPLHVDVADKMVVFYVVPDAHAEDRAIHHLVVDQSGRIIEASQGQGLSHQNLQLTDSAGTYNPATVIGLPYTSEGDCFLRRHVALYDNEDAYMLLAEVSLIERGLPDDLIVCDVRRAGGVPTDDQLDAVLKQNPRVLQSRIVYGEQGQQIAKDQVLIAEPHLSLLEDYGGDLSQDQAESLIRRHVNAWTLVVFDWQWDKSRLSASSLTLEQVDLEWTWEGPGLLYKVYRRSNPTGEWTEVHSVDDPPKGTLTWTDLEVSSGETHYYCVRITKNGVEYPSGNSIAVKVS